MVRIADEKQGDKRFELVRQISELADGVTLEYVKGLSDIISDPEADAKKKAKAFAEMDKVLRIAKQYSDRVLLAEGKNTANLGLGGMPFNVVITKTYEKQDSVDSGQEPETDD
jgi:hypothetical protein